MAKKKVNDELDDTTELATDQADIEDGQVESPAEPPEENAWLAATPKDGKVDLMFCSAALGIPTGAVETRLATLNSHEQQQVIEARKTANHQMVRAQFANAANRNNKPKIEKGKQPQQ